MTDNLRKVYYETFYSFIEKRYGTVERDEIKNFLDILFNYSEERDLDIFSFSLEDTNSFLLWYEKEAESMDIYERLLRVVTDFYNFLVVIDHAEENPFKGMKDLKLADLLKKVKERFPDKKLFNPETGEEL